MHLATLWSPSYPLWVFQAEVFTLHSLTAKQSIKTWNPFAHNVLEKKRQKYYRPSSCETTLCWLEKKIHSAPEWSATHSVHCYLFTLRDEHCRKLPCQHISVKKQWFSHLKTCHHFHRERKDSHHLFTTHMWLHTFTLFPPGTRKVIHKRENTKNNEEMSGLGSGLRSGSRWPSLGVLKLNPGVFTPTAADSFGLVWMKE